jgi:protein-L-isoaspartate O-methyltransferase
MVIPLNDETKTVMRRITRIEENEYEEEQFIDCAFVPMLKGKAY